MEITDANFILRYLLKDNIEFFEQARVVLENNKVPLPIEVFAEVVYVFEKVYKIPRKNINEALQTLLSYSNINTSDNSLLNESLHIYEAENIDFIDSVLVARNHLYKAKIHSFDKKLIKLCK